MSPLQCQRGLEEVLLKRKTKVQSCTSINYGDEILGKSDLSHTPPIPLIYALHEALRIVLEEV